MLPRFIGSMGPCRSVGPTMFRLSHLNVVAIIRRKKVRTDRRSPFTIILAEDEKQTLEGMARQYTSSYFQVIRSKIILLAAEGLTIVSTQRQMESRAACIWAATSTIPARPSSAAVFDQSLFKGNQTNTAEIYEIWRIRSTLESRVAVELASGRCQTEKPLPGREHSVKSHGSRKVLHPFCRSGSAVSGQGPGGSL